VAEDDGWYQEVPPTQGTEVRIETAKTIITRNNSPDLPFDRSINPYRGCEHGCIYCYARPSHAYWDLSPGLDFETRLIAKTNAATVLEQQLSKPGYVCAPINLGSNTDPYQPIEREYRITRQTLEVLLRYRHPVTIITKGALILRDLDLLTELARQRLVAVMISLTSLDDELKRILEPRRGAQGALAGDSGDARGGYSGGRVVFADDSDDQRQRTGEPADRSPRRRRAERGVHDAAPAPGSGAAVRGVAGGALPAARGPCDEPDPPGARWRAVRQPVRRAHARRGAVRRSVGPAFRKALKRLGLDRREGFNLDCTAFCPPGGRWHCCRQLTGKNAPFL
jgi:hypothetical protein